MDISTEDIGGVKVVQFTGNLDTNTAPDAEGALKKLTEEDGAKIIVDFTTVDFVSSAGLRVLLVTAKLLKRSAGALRICGLNETVEEVFEISGFSAILKVFTDQAAALEGF